MNVYLVRHAHAGERGAWREDDRSRPLTPRGQAQARGIAQQLDGHEVSKVLSSPFVRCVETVTPLATARGLPLHTERLLAEGADWQETFNLIRDLAAPSVLCSQGDVIGGIVSNLVELGLVEPDAARWQKGSTWVLDIHDGRVRSAAYLPPLEV